MEKLWTPNSVVQWPLQGPGAQHNNQIANSVFSVSIDGGQGQPGSSSQQQESENVQGSPRGRENQGRIYVSNAIVAQLQIVPNNALVNQGVPPIQNNVIRDDMASPDNQGPQNPGLEREREEDPAALNEERKVHDGRNGPGGSDGPTD